MAGTNSLSILVNDVPINLQSVIQNYLTELREQNVLDYQCRKIIDSKLISTLGVFRNLMPAHAFPFRDIVWKESSNLSPQRSDYDDIDTSDAISSTTLTGSAKELYIADLETKINFLVNLVGNVRRKKGFVALFVQSSLVNGTEKCVSWFQENIITP